MATQSNAEPSASSRRWIEIADPATLAALDWEAYLELIAHLAATDLGVSRVLGVAPLSSPEAHAERLADASEVERALLEGPLVPATDEPVAAAAAAIGGSGDLEGSQLVLLAGLLGALERLRERVADDSLPRLATRLARLPSLDALLALTRQTLDPRGEIRDDASPALRRLREGVRRRREEVYGVLRSVMEAHREDLADEVFPVRDGRVVLVVQSAARGRLGGLLHGRSGTGRSVYLEPLAAVEVNNALRQASDEEQAERSRLLRRLVDAWRAAAPVVGQAFDLLAELDALQSAARFAELCEARIPFLSEDGTVRLAGARHPLLEPRLEDLRREALGSSGHQGAVVPLELELAAELQALAVTGPNAGGKTVALKTVGLCVLAARAGLPFPCARATAVPWLVAVAAAIGDEQDVLRERSTFSGRLERVRAALEVAAPGALVLLDELGSGTDPEEGAALGAALVEAFLARGARVLLTTHLAALAAHLADLAGAATAAMEFDPERGQPRFRLRIGAPAGSHALALARRLGLPEAVLGRAEALLGEEAARLRRTLAEVETLRERLREEEVAARAARLEIERLAQSLETERFELATARREVGREATRRLASFRAEVQSRLAAVQRELEEQLRAGRRRGVVAGAVEALFADAPVAEGEEEPAVDPGALVVGSRVRHRLLGWSGRIAAVDGERVEVAASGGMRLRAQAGELVAEQGPDPQRVARPVKLRPGSTSDASERSVSSELVLIGKRIEDALAELEQYLDQALLAGWERVRIVHGHGTGRLRRAVREALARHRGVVEASAAADNEGGDGATIAILGR